MSSVPKVTGDPIIDRTIAEMNKQFSKDIISLGIGKESYKTFSTGSLSLDLATGIGGWPAGGIIEIYGLESSGKTSTGLLALAEWQRASEALGQQDLYALIVDVEHSMTGALFKGFNIDMTRVIYSKPDSSEESLQITMNLVKTGKVGFVLFDSIGSLITELQLGKDVGATDVGGTSKQLARFFREYCKLAENLGVTSIFLNQLTYNPGIKMGNPETTPGGGALRYAAWMRLKAYPAKGSENNTNAYRQRLKFVKNKCRPPRATEVEFDFIYAKGPDPAVDVLNAAKDLGIMAFAGPTLKLRHLDGTEETVSKGGLEGWKTAVATDDTLLDKVRTACLDIMKTT